jgi:ring-1,2-phenylacetyl-CoA epoxidase subunit PaaE
VTDTALAPPRHAVFHRLVVSRVEPLTEDSIAITFDVPPELAEDYRFGPGQHVAILAPTRGDEVRRNYSICEPAGSPILRVAVKRLPGGVFSSWAHTDLRPGDSLEVMTPVGRFCPPLDPRHTKRYTAIAAGSGITPVLSILGSVLRVEPASSFTLIYQNRTSASIMFLEDLEDLKNRFPDRLELIHILSREPQEVELLHGRVDGPKLNRILDVLVPPEAVDEWFLCGPAAMIEEARATLLGRGVASAQVHRELFHSEPSLDHRQRVSERVPGRERAHRVMIKLDGRTSTFDLRAGEGTILEATLRVRPDAPYACKEGVCGTCRAKLVEGKVEMDHPDALEEAEVEAGFVLACQSYPASEKVSLDFDQ